jgi:PhnB protein
VSLHPYLFFDGRCDEAIEFYKSALGAEVQMLMRFGDAPAETQQHMTQPKDLVMHARLNVAGSTILASDGHGGGAPTFQGFALSVTTQDVDDAKAKFAALSEGGQVRMPLDKTFFSPCFGMVADRFGVLWMVYVGD